MPELTISEQIQQSAITSGCLEEAAQKFVEILYEKSEGKIVLARLFATVPYEKLPKDNISFVDKLSKANRIEHLITDKTLVLSLLGTRGINDKWNERRNSKNHIGIPLASSHFIEQIPMMSRLLKKLGLNLDWIDSKDSDIIKKSFGRLSGLFYVRDADSETDLKGRKIISAKDFVDKYNVKTVFGFGGGFIVGNTFMVTIIFTSETMEKEQADKFLSLFGVFKIGVREMISSETIFI